MIDWFDDVIKESITKESNYSEDNTNVEEMRDVLSSLGYDVSNISIVSNKKPVLEDNIGKKVCTNYNLVVASNILMKTQYNLYKISKVVLPKGYIGVIGGVEDGKYIVSFDANLPISKDDITSGYDGTDLTYPLDQFNLSESEIQIM
jgi:hypothetical protein